MSLYLCETEYFTPQPVKYYYEDFSHVSPSAPWSAAIIILLLGFGIQSREVFLAIYIRCDISSSWSRTSERR